MSKFKVGDRVRAVLQKVWVEGVCAGELKDAVMAALERGGDE